jgi:DNA-binding NtrC family response regulator
MIGDKGGKGDVVRVWFCSTDSDFAQLVARTLGPGFEVRLKEGFEPGDAQAQEHWYGVALIDVRDSAFIDAGLALVDEINQQEAPPPVLVMLSAQDQEVRGRVLEKGVYDTVACPPDVVELRLLLRRAFKWYDAEKQLKQLRTQDGSGERLGEMVGATESMQQVFALARKIAACDVTALITGETGTGKELLARAIHRLSPRSSGAFVAFSCANLPETLVDDELFGHERGAFTGAVAARRGRFESADGGTLFLDEIGDLPLPLQAKLLRVLQERTFERLGSNASHSINIRLLCATHRNLQEMVKLGTFREDLYYRLNVVQLQIPPLRERRDGVAVLAYHFLEHFAEQFGKKTKRFSSLALGALEEYDWPGNVRQLENVVQRAVVLAEGATVEIWHLPNVLSNGFRQQRLAHSYDDEVRDFKRRLILRTLHECGGNKAETARTLGLARGYLHRLINQLQIQREEESFEGAPEESPIESARVM